jgi:hypothetical protein
MPPSVLGVALEVSPAKVRVSEEFGATPLKAWLSGSSVFWDGADHLVLRTTRKRGIILIDFKLSFLQPSYPCTDSLA